MPRPVQGKLALIAGVTLPVDAGEVIM